MQGVRCSSCSIWLSLITTSTYKNLHKKKSIGLRWARRSSDSFSTFNPAKREMSQSDAKLHPIVTTSFRSFQKSCLQVSHLSKVAKKCSWCSPFSLPSNLYNLTILPWLSLYTSWRKNVEKFQYLHSPNEINCKYYVFLFFESCFCRSKKFSR